MLLWIVSKRQGNVKCASQTRGWGPSLGLPTEIKDSSRGLVHHLKIIFSLTCLHVLSLYSDENLKLTLQDLVPFLLYKDIFFNTLP